MDLGNEPDEPREVEAEPDNQPRLDGDGDPGVPRVGPDGQRGSKCHELPGSGEGSLMPDAGADASSELRGSVVLGEVCEELDISRGGPQAECPNEPSIPSDCEGYEPSVVDPSEEDRALDEWFGDKLYPARGSHAAGRELLERCAEDKAKLDDEADAENRPIKMVELVFVEPLDSKGPNEVAHATARICAQLEVLKLPIARIHTDAGSEFISTPFRRFVDARGILHTAAAPQEHNSNGRVENVVRRLKQQVRTILLANARPPDKWACAARAVAARWRSDTLARLGWPQPTLAPYGTKTQILTRTWHRRRQSEWKARAEDGIVLCPASLVKHGYVVLVGDMLKLATKLFRGDSPNLQVVATNPDGDEPPFEEGELPAPVRRHSAKRPVVLAKVGCERRGTPQAVDQFARELAATTPFDVDAALAFVAQLSLSDLDASRDNGKRLHSGKHHVFGQFVHGGVSGVTKNTKRYSGVAALLTKLVRHAVPHAEFTTVVLSTDAEAVLHRDVHNHPLYPNHIVTVQAPSSGGGLWVQTVSGDEQSGPAVCKTLPTGQVAQGQVFPLGQPFQFNSHRWHCTEPWPCGEHRVVLSAYTVSRPDKLKGAERAELTSLGFNVPPQEQFSNVAVAQQGGATPLKELENPKNLKNSIIQNPKKLESEGVGPVAEEQAAACTCSCCERDCVVCSKLFVKLDAVCFAGVSPEATVEREVSAEPDLSMSVPCCCVVGCEEFEAQLFFDSFRPTNLEDTPDRACDEEAYEQEVEQALFLEPRELEGDAWALEGLLNEHSVVSKLIAHERQEFITAFEEHDLKEACEGAILSELLVKREELECELRALSLRDESAVAVCVCEASFPETLDEHAVQEDTPEQVLQTKIVPNWQVLQNFEVWRPAVVAEFLSLTEDKEALEPVTQERLDELSAKGVKVTVIPSKLICSIKAPKGRLKARIVACGNFLGTCLGESKAQRKHDLYSSGVDLTHLRMLLAYSSRRGMPVWSVDIKTAFLNSELLPRNREGAQEAVAHAGTAHAVRRDSPESENPAEYVVLNPPRVLVSKGVVPVGTFLIVKKAVYGLDQSPRDWGFTRDAELRTLKIPWKSKLLKLVQSLADDCVWFVVDVETVLVQDPDFPVPAQSQEVLGWIAVYIDDILGSGIEDLGEGVIRAVCEKWACSDPEKVGSDPSNPVRFLGLELYWSREGRLVVTQTAYAKDLLSRYTNEFVASVQPLPQGLEDPVAVPNPNAESIRKCQQVVGELLWLSIRTRVDLCFAVSKLAQWSTKDPEFTFRQALQVLGYLSVTPSVGLVFAGPKDRDEHNLVGMQDYTHALQAYTDASHAPGGDRSHECTVLRCEGSTVSWVSTRQPFCTQSSCEAELLSTTTGSNYAVAHVGLARELWQHEPRVFVANDNLSAITLINSPTVSWRTRHLKIRARVLKERSDMKLLVFVHVGGDKNGADIGTKALGPQRIKTLMAVLGMSAQDPPAETTKAKSVQHVKDCLRAVILACCLCNARATKDQDRTQSSEDWSLVVFAALISITSIAVWEACKACLRAVFRQAEDLLRPRLPAPEPEELFIPEQPEDEYEGPDPDEAPVARVRDPVPAMTPEEGLRRRPPRPVAQQEPDVEPQGRPITFAFADDEVQVFMPGPADAPANPPEPVHRDVVAQPRGPFQARPLRLNHPPDPPYILARPHAAANYEGNAAREDVMGWRPIDSLPSSAS